MTQASFLPSLDLSLMKNRRGAEAAGEKAGTPVHIRDNFSQRLDSQQQRETKPLVGEVKGARNLEKTHRKRKVGRGRMLRRVKEDWRAQCQ